MGCFLRKRQREVSKYPLLATILSTSMRLNPATRGVSVEIEEVLKRVCDPAADFQYLHDYPEQELDRGLSGGDFSKYTTSLKRFGALEWL